MSTQSLRIAHVTLNYKPYSGGVVSSLLALTQELRNQNHIPSIITLNYTGNDAHEPNVYRIKCWGSIRHKGNPITLPIKPRAQLSHLFSQLKPDIIHIHHPFIIGPAAVKAAKNLNIPTVFTHHSIYELYAHYIPLPASLVCKVCKKLVGNFCNTVDHIVAPSVSIKERLSGQGIITPMTIIPSPVNPLFLQHNVQQKKPLGSRAIKLLSVSRFVPEKNITWLLDVFNKLIRTSTHQFTFTLVGYGAWKAQLESHTYKGLNLNPLQVQFIERPTKEFLIKLYQEADIFVFASQSETQGIVHAEAMSQATPVVALEGPGTNDVIRSGFNGFLVNSPLEFIEKINQISAGQNIFESLQTGALETSKEYYPAQLTQKMIELYQSLVPQK